MVIILAVSGITDITVRDIGLLAAAVVLIIESWPASPGPGGPENFINNINNLNKENE